MRAQIQLVVTAQFLEVRHLHAVDSRDRQRNGQLLALASVQGMHRRQAALQRRRRLLLRQLLEELAHLVPADVACKAV
ncbi:hypothetical protein D3C86_1927480 [compost metagenome]